jgi:hypothetical protein
MYRYKIFGIITFVIFAALASLCMPIQSHAGGGQRAWQGTAGSPEQFLIEVSKGNVPGHSMVHKFGQGTVGTTLVPITNSLVYQTPIAAVSLEIVSSVAGDALDDVGAHEYTVIGLDANWNEITQVVAAHATTGLTAVAVPIDMIRVYRWYVSLSGTYATQTANSHVGTITLRVASAGATWSSIGILPRPTGQSQIACYTVPDGYQAYVFLQEVRVDSTKSADVVFMARHDADDVVTPFPAMRMVANFVGISGIASADPNAPRDGFAAPADLMFMGKISSGVAQIVVDFEILLVKDGY